MLRPRSEGQASEREAAGHQGVLDTLTHQVWCDLDTVPVYGGMMQELSEPAPPHPVTTQLTKEYEAANASVL